MGETIRAFIAFDLPAHIIQTVEALQQELKRDGLTLRWVRPLNIHLTLKFIGELPVDRMASVTNAMTRAMQAQAPARLTLQGMGVFPHLRRPKVLWMGLGGEVDRVAGIQAALEEGLSAEGFERDHRPFRAHLTLARIPDRFDARRLPLAIKAAGDYDSQPFICRELVLFKSDLQPRGAVYTPLSSVMLGNAAAPVLSDNAAE